MAVQVPRTTSSPGLVLRLGDDDEEVLLSALVDLGDAPGGGHHVSRTHDVEKFEGLFSVQEHR